MLAPFIESLFAAIFPSLPKEIETNRREGISKVIPRLAEWDGLAHFFPDDYENVLEALFLYRNKMFHNGFIWPENGRKKFRKKINESGWPQSWFEETTHKDSLKKTETPWIFCMSTEFIEHCLWTIRLVLDGYGRSHRTAREE